MPTPLTIETGDLVALFVGGARRGGDRGHRRPLRPARALAAHRAGRAGARRGRARASRITVINNPFGPGVIRFNAPFSLGFTVFWIVGMINSINWIDGLDGLSSGIALIAAVTLGLISLTTQVGQPLIAVLCFALAGVAARVPALELPPGDDLQRHERRAVRRLHPGGAVDPRVGQGRGRAARPRRPDHRHVLDHRPAAVAGPLAVHARTARTSTTGCSTSGLSHRDTVLVIYGICVALAVLALLVLRGDPGVRVPRRLHRLGPVLFGPTRGAFRRPEELDAESYDRPDEGPPETNDHVGGPMLGTHDDAGAATDGAHRRPTNVEVELEREPYELEGSAKG